MEEKKSIREKYFLKRKKKYFEISKNFFIPLIKLIKLKYENRKMNIALYYPSSYEVNVLKSLDFEHFKKFTILLPIVDNKNIMNFFKWKKNQVLNINKYGIPEPIKSKKIVPQIVLLPLLAFDDKKNRFNFFNTYLLKSLLRFLKISFSLLFFFNCLNSLIVFKIFIFNLLSNL